MRLGFGRKGGKGRGIKGGRGSEDGSGAGGSPTNCVCPACGLVMPREPGIPCFQRRCPTCGSPMARQFLKG